MIETGNLNDQESKFRIVCRHPFFEGLPSDIQFRLMAHVASKSYTKDSVIFNRGDAGSSLLLIYSGSVRIGVQSLDGKDAVFRFLNEGEYFGEIALLDGRPRTADAYAHTDCELLAIYRRDLMTIVDSHPPLMHRLLQVLCTRLRRTTEQVEYLMFADLAGRLARTLVELAPISKIPGQICATQSDIAKIAGVSREMTNKQLRIWAKKNWIALGRKEITVLCPDELTKMALPALIEPCR